MCDIEMSELPCWLWRLNSAAGADIIGVRCSRLETAASPSDLVTSLLSLSLSLSPASDQLCLIFNFHPVLSRLVIIVLLHFHRLSGLETETDRFFVEALTAR